MTFIFNALKHLKSQPPRLFVILAAPRCRSRYLADLLNSHPHAACHGEIFHQRVTDIYLPLPEQDDLFNLSLRKVQPEKFIHQMLNKTLAQHPLIKKVGCKLMLYPHQINQGLEPLFSFKPKIIWLKRENLLAWYSSYKISLETNIWAVAPSQDFKHQITFDYANYRDMIENQVLATRYALDKLHAYQLPYLTVEADSLKHTEIMAGILKFLELPDAELKSSMLEQNPRRVLDRFKNPETVMAFAASINQLAWLD